MAQVLAVFSDMLRDAGDEADRDDDAPASS
jgi:hypothetical protein